MSFAPSQHDTVRPNSIGSFSVLVDPWLNGDSTIFHRKFALAKHTIPCSIDHLSEIPTPNVVVISQDRADHCHEATLKQLDPDLPHTIIFAHPAAAKKIRGWKYFKASKVVAFPTYNERRSDTIIRFKVPSGSPELEPGEVTLAFIPTKFDITQLHNGIGITYRPPMRAQTPRSPALSPVTVMGQPNTPIGVRMPLTPPDSPTLLSSFGELSANPVLEVPPAPKGALNKLRSRSHGALRAAAMAQAGPWRSTDDLSKHPLPPLPNLPSVARPASPPPSSPALSLMSSHTLSTVKSNVSNTSSMSPSRRARTLSVIYAPHGASYQAVRQYATSHLIKRAGLPLTLLLHSWDRVTNAWYLGGNIISGLPGGVDIAKDLLAQCWISAHDEDKDSSGLAVLKCTVSKYSAEDVKRLLAAPYDEPWKASARGRNSSRGSDSSKGDAPSTPRATVSGPSIRRNKLMTDVRQMACGETTVLTVA